MVQEAQGQLSDGGSEENVRHRDRRPGKAEMDSGDGETTGEFSGCLGMDREEQMGRW